VRAPLSCKQVYHRKAAPVRSAVRIDRHGDGFWSTAIVAGVSVPIGLAVKGVRSRVETEFETCVRDHREVCFRIDGHAMGAVPTATSVTPATGARLARSRIVTVFAELWFTTARRKRRQPGR